MNSATLIACEQLGRRCYMMELDTPYADVIVQRWEGFTGKKAQRISADAEEKAPAQKAKTPRKPSGLDLAAKCSRRPKSR